jgi:DNA primase
MSSSQWAHQRIGDFYVDAVLPALAARLDQAFPEFGWKQDARGWVASNEEMTHRVLGVRADRVVAHGAAPSGFLVHGGSSTLWTAYLNGGVVPRGEAFREVVSELAARAGIDLASPERSSPRDRRTDLLHDFYGLCRDEFRGATGVAARSYLEGRGFPSAAIDEVDLGVVPNELSTKRALQTAGYSELEIAQSGVIADGRWPGRLCGAWRDERGHIGTFWTRSLGDSDSTTRYLYLRGASRSVLPPYRFSEVIRQSPTDRRELVLVEGLIDVHRLRADGMGNVAAVGGARMTPEMISHVSRATLDSLVLAFDNDAAGRDGISAAVDAFSRSSAAPTIRVIEPTVFGDSKDPDAYVRHHGLDDLRALISQAGCGVSWRAREFLDGITPADEPQARRTALARAGEWLGALPPRLSLEQEDAVRVVAERCGYSVPAVERSFRARFWRDPPLRGQEIQR